MYIFLNSFYCSKTLECIIFIMSKAMKGKSSTQMVDLTLFKIDIMNEIRPTLFFKTQCIMIITRLYQWLSWSISWSRFICSLEYVFIPLHSNQGALTSSLMPRFVDWENFVFSSDEDNWILNDQLRDNFLFYVTKCLSYLFSICISASCPVNIVLWAFKVAAYKYT